MGRGGSGTLGGSGWGTVGLFGYLDNVQQVSVQVHTIDYIFLPY
jgi:hypothetical protein